MACLIHMQDHFLSINYEEPYSKTISYPLIMKGWNTMLFLLQRILWEYSDKANIANFDKNLHTKILYISWTGMYVSAFRHGNSAFISAGGEQPLSLAPFALSLQTSCTV